MKFTNQVKCFSVAFGALWMAGGVCSAQTEAAGYSGGPLSASDQQVQAIDQIGKQQQQKVDLFTGSFGYSIPIACAPARNGSEPKLALGYSSGGDLGWCGMGWDLNIGYIERNTRDGFPIAYSSATPAAPLPQYNDSKGFILSLGGSQTKIYAVSTNSTIVEYGAETETEFLRCFLDTVNNNWTVYDKSGNAYYFGESTNTRVTNPKPGWSGYSGTFRWAMDQIVTATGDWTVVGYTNYISPNTGLPERTLYPAQITYNGHTNVNGYTANYSGPNTIVFQTAIRTNDWRFSYRWGFRTEQCRRLTNIICQAGSQNVWSYNLQYAVSPATSRSLLANVIVYGYNTGNTATALLTNTFTYQGNPNAVSFGPTIVWSNLVLSVPGTTSGSYNNEVAQINSSSSGAFTFDVADLIDIDGDGLPDRVVYDTNAVYCGYQVQKNLGMQANGTGSFGSPYYFGPTATGSQGVPSVSNPFPNQSGFDQLNTPYGRIRDINGDGLPDRVMDDGPSVISVLNTNGVLPYVPFTNYEVQINTGQGFSGVTNWPVSPGPVTNTDANSGYYYCVESGGVNVGFFDINGDGLPDRVMSGWYQQGPMTNFMVQLNTGTNFTQPVAFSYHSQNYNATNQSQQYTWAGIETVNAHMIDLNGDGLPDRLMFPMTSAGTGVEQHPTTYYAVEYNDGYSFESTNTSTSVPGAFDQWPGGAGLETPNGSTWADSINNLPYVGLFDVNGDGLPDRVMLNWSANTNNGATSTSWLVFLNNGHGFNSTPIVVNGIQNQGQNGPGEDYFWSMEGEMTGVGIVSTLIDINGDGLLDRVMAVYYPGYGNANSASNFFLVQLNQGPFPDLLVTINNGIGGSIAVNYNSSVAYDNRVDPTNPNSVSHMPFPKQVASTVTVSDGINSPQTTTYGYGGGYYDGPRREFHGFAVVTNTDPTLRYTVTYFHTGGGRNYAALGEYQDTNAANGLGNFAKAGTAYRVETYGNDNALYHVTINQVNQASLGLGRYFPYTSLSFDCDYPGPKATATAFAFDLTCGNLTNKLEYGQVTNFNPSSVGTFSFSDVTPADNRNHNTTYATISGNTNIVDHPATVILADVNNNTVQETDYSYNPSSGTVAAKLTRISPTSFATNSYGNYTAFGLVGQTIDPVGIQTSITYDSIYNTYPATTTVGGTFTTTTSYDPRSGQLAVSTDPAGLTISNSFDIFCRPTEVDKIAIGGSSVVWQKKISYPAVLQPIVSGLAVNYVDVVANDGVTGGMESRSYIDGLGRPIQTITQGEASNYRMVATAYDPRGAAFLTTWPTFVTSTSYTKPASGLTASWTGFDAAGRPATNEPVSVNFVNGAFSSASLLTSDTGSPVAAETRSYALNGTDPWWIICTDADGKTRRYGLDAFGRTNQIQELDGGNTYTTTLNYDLANNLTNVVNANNENIYWAYNDASGLVAMADPYLGQWTYQRDYANRLRIQTDGRGDVVQLSYVNAAGNQDPLGRLQTKLVYATNYTSRTLTLYSGVTNFYDSSDDLNFTVYPGLLYKTVDSQGWEKNGYDQRTRTVITARHLNINNETYTNSYGFDDGDNVTSMTYPNAGPTITYSYWHGGNINLVSRGSYNYYTVTASGYDEFQHVTNFTYGNLLTTSRSYYSHSKRLQNISCGSVFSRGFGYTAGDDIVTLSGTGLTNTTVTYDNLHRIKTYSPGLTGSYGYDAVGNISNSIEGGGSAYAYANPRKQAVRTAFGYTNLYDLCGNMMVRHGGLTNSQGLTYDPENRLTAVAQAGVMSDEFGYADSGARLWKRINQNPTNIQVWIGNNYEEKGGKVLFHVFAGAEQICTFETNSTLYGGSDTNRVAYYYHEDNLNSSSVLSSGGLSGIQIEVDSYYPFGRQETASPQASFQVSRRFTGQVFDSESGLYYYNFRYYDPELGRFIQPDDRIPDLSNPQSYNRYSYVLNNPLRYDDPTGHADHIWDINNEHDSDPLIADLNRRSNQAADAKMATIMARQNEIEMTAIKTTVKNVAQLGLDSLSPMNAGMGPVGVVTHVGGEAKAVGAAEVGGTASIAKSATDATAKEASAEIGNLGPLSGLSKPDIEAKLQAAGYSSTTANNGGSIWTKASADGNTAAVRIDPAMVRSTPKGFADEVPHVHKEIVPTSRMSGGNYAPADATKLNDAGHPTTDPRQSHIPGGN